LNIFQVCGSLGVECKSITVQCYQAGLMVDLLCSDRVCHVLRTRVFDSSLVSNICRYLSIYADFISSLQLEYIPEHDIWITFCVHLSISGDRCGIFYKLQLGAFCFLKKEGAGDQRSHKPQELKSYICGGF
jgi:hypothetical protein